MIKKLGLILGILIAALILIAAGVLIGKYGLSQTPTATTLAPAPQPTLTTSIPTAPALTTHTPTPSQTLTGIPSNSDKVDFRLQITSVNETGALSRSITGEIGNAGNIDAHNVVCTVEIYSNGNQIKINGQDSISKTLGTIGAGKTVTTTLDLTFGLFDSPTLLKNGATVYLQIASDEKTQLLSYDYKP